MSEAVKKVSEQEAEALASAPALFVNRMFVTFMGPSAKLTFGEQSEDGKRTFMRAAVVMDNSNLVQFRDLLIEMLKDAHAVEINPPANG